MRVFLQRNPPMRHLSFPMVAKLASVLLALIYVAFGVLSDLAQQSWTRV